MLFIKNLQQSLTTGLKLQSNILGATSLIASFTTRSRTTTTPQIIKDPKFTRRGIQKEKKKEHNIDREQPYLAHSELYFDAKEDKKLERKERKSYKRLQEHNEANYQSDSFEGILGQIKDEELLNRASSRVLNSIIDLEDKYPEKIEEVKDVIAFSLQRLIRRVYTFNLREFGILVTLSSRYISNEKESFQNLITYFIALIEKKEYQGEKILERERNEKNFVFIFGNLISLGNQLGANVTNLVEKTQKYAVDQINNIKSPSHQILFITNLCVHLKENSQLVKTLIEKVSTSISTLNFNDVTAIIQLFAKLKILDQTVIVQKLESRACDLLQNDKEINLSKISILIQSLSNVSNHKVSDKLKQEFLRVFRVRGSNEITKGIDLGFFAEGLYRLNILNKDSYIQIENIAKKIGASNFTLKNISQIIRSLGKSLENKMSVPLLESLARRADELLKSKKYKISQRESSNILALFKFVQEKNRIIIFESLETL